MYVYAVTCCEHEKSGKPAIFLDKLAAYKKWAEVLLIQANLYNIIDYDLFCQSIDHIKDFTHYFEFEVYIENFFKEKENVSIVIDGVKRGVKNGYTLRRNNYSKIVIQIFTVEIKE